MLNSPPDDEVFVLDREVCGRERNLSDEHDAALTQLRDQGDPVREEDAARLSPLGHAHLNCLGRYTFTASAPNTGLRALRDPDATDDADDAAL
nr:Tn3 family transposase [Actinopolyspora mortivallis]